MADAGPTGPAPTRFELRHGDATRPAEAEVIRYTDATRISRGVGAIAAGILFGGICIIVPILHLITTWALPLLGIAAGVYLLNTRYKVKGLRGECPACGKEVELSSGSPDGPVKAVCPKCRQFLEVVPIGAAEGGSTA